jgi:cation:H+ antiporter
MTSIAIIGLTYRAEKKQLRMSWDSIAMIFVYIANLMLLYMYK